MKLGREVVELKTPWGEKSWPAQGVIKEKPLRCGESMNKILDIFSKVKHFVNNNNKTLHKGRYVLCGRQDEPERSIIT
jgi:hypothetical protein